MPRPSKLRVVSHKHVGERVRALRLSHDLTQNQLAALLGTSQTALSELERGNRGLSVQQVVKLSKALKVTPNDILGDGKRERTARQQPHGRILRRLARIERLPAAQQQAILKLLDGIIEAHARHA